MYIHYIRVYYYFVYMFCKYIYLNETREKGVVFRYPMGLSSSKQKTKKKHANGYKIYIYTSGTGKHNIYINIYFS
jgi:hypothetical protein